MVDLLIEATPELRAGRRALEELKGVRLLEDWRYCEISGDWLLFCELTADVNKDGPIPNKTNWYVCAQENYPSGRITFFPAKQGGITKTFPNQGINNIGVTELPYRTGWICLENHVFTLNDGLYNAEPPEPEYRLRWRFDRALRWLHHASFNTLQPYELPFFPLRTTRFIFKEREESFNLWKDVEHKWGVVEASINEINSVILVRRFLSTERKEIRSPQWGKFFDKTGYQTIDGLWLLLDGAPVIPPWRPPVNFGELREAFRFQGLNFDEWMQKNVRYIRDANRHILLLGFPIPEGKTARQIHWQALLLPALSQRTDDVEEAIRHQFDEDYYCLKDRLQILRDETEVEWLMSKNWDKDELTARGSLPNSVTEKKVFLIGAGALGSVTAEMLVRAGTHGMTVIDDDSLFEGNLTRHTLTLNELYSAKAEALAKRLNATSPNARIEYMSSKFPPVYQAGVDKILTHDVMIDTTGKDSVLESIADLPAQNHKNGSKLFISLSLGFMARRLFCYANFLEAFTQQDFQEFSRKWLVKEREEFDMDNLPMEGLGCHSPVFPARVDDVWMLASVGVKFVQSVLEHPGRTFRVYEQVYDGNDQYVGIQIAK